MYAGYAGSTNSDFTQTLASKIDAAGKRAIDYAVQNSSVASYLSRFN